MKDNGKAALRQVIAGLGGVGKTATATEYAHRFGAEYSCVLWTLADSETSLFSGFAGFAAPLGLPPREKQPELVEDVKRWLSTNTDWLLVLDNADTPDIVKPFLPNPCGGSVLLTSRAQTFDVLHIKSPVDLGVMTPDEALDFLKERTQPPDLQAAELTAVQTLAQELGYFPLALEQAGAYILATQTPFAKYLTLYQQRHLEILEKKKPVAGDYKGTVATTWTMNFEQVEQESPASADLLRFSAFLAPDDIPMELIEKGASAIGPGNNFFIKFLIGLKNFFRKLVQKPNQRKNFNPELTLAAAISSGKTIFELLEPLTRFSLVWVDAERQMYSVHRLVQMVIQSRMDKPTQAQWAKKVVLAVNQVFPKVEFQNWSQCARLLPQTLQAAELGQQYELSLLELTRLLNQAGYYLNDCGRYGEAEPLLLEALELRRKALPAGHPLIAQSLNNLAGSYKEQGRYGEAELLLLEALELRRKALPAGHSDIAQSLNNLAELYREQGRYGEAEPLYLEALEIDRTGFPLGHPDIATSLNNLALLYQSQGRYGEAKLLYEEALEIDRKALPTGHPSIAINLNNLAALYFSQGRYGEAEPLLLAALEIRRKGLPAGHPDIATNLNDLAALYFSQGRSEEAEPLYLEVLEIMRKGLPAGHPWIATSLNNLAELYREQGRYGEAEPLYLEVLEMKRKGLPAGHPSIASSLNNLALLYQSQGQSGEAEPLFLEALEIWRKALPAGHPDIATSLNNLALLYDSQGQSGEAEPLLLEALAMRRQGLPAGHPDIAQSLNNLAGLYSSQGRYGEAEPLYLEALEIKRKGLPAGHPDIALSLNNLGLLYWSQGRYRKAEPLYLEAISIVKKSLGKTHTNTLKMMKNYTILLRKMGRKTEAKTIEAEIRTIREQAKT